MNAISVLFVSFGFEPVVEIPLLYWLYWGLTISSSALHKMCETLISKTVINTNTVSIISIFATWKSMNEVSKIEKIDKTKLRVSFASMFALRVAGFVFRRYIAFPSVENSDATCVLFASKIRSIKSKLKLILICCPRSLVSMLAKTLFKRNIASGRTKIAERFVASKLGVLNESISSFLSELINLLCLTFFFWKRTTFFLYSNGLLVILKKSGLATK